MVLRSQEGSREQEESREIVSVIAGAIHKSDRSLFFENYAKQARAVLRALEERGYRVLPTRATGPMIEKGSDKLKAGVHRPSEMAASIYRSMLEGYTSGW